MTVYLLHITPPLRHSRHYIGFARDEAQMRERLKRHQNGTGGVLPREAVKRNNSVIKLAYVWPDAPREFEKYIKRYGGAVRYCPLCNVNSRPIPRMESYSKQSMNLGLFDGKE